MQGRYPKRCGRPMEAGPQRKPVLTLVFTLEASGTGRMIHASVEGKL